VRREKEEGERRGSESKERGRERGRTRKGGRVRREGE